MFWSKRFLNFKLEILDLGFDGQNLLWNNAPRDSSFTEQLWLGMLIIIIIFFKVIIIIIIIIIIIAFLFVLMFYQY